MFHSFFFYIRPFTFQFILLNGYNVFHVPMYHNSFNKTYLRSFGLLPVAQAAKSILVPLFLCLCVNISVGYIFGSRIAEKEF